MFSGKKLVEEEIEGFRAWERNGQKLIRNDGCNSSSSSLWDYFWE